MRSIAETEKVNYELIREHVKPHLSVVRLCELIGRAHFAVSHASDDEENDTGADVRFLIFLCSWDKHQQACILDYTRTEQCST